MSIKKLIEEACEVRAEHQGAMFHPHDFTDGALWAMRWWAEMWLEQEKGRYFNATFERFLLMETIVKELDAAAKEIFEGKTNGK